MTTKSSAAAIPLLQLTGEQAALAGAKAASLAELAQAGFPVPEGWAIPAGTEPDIDELCQVIGDCPVAVRSSGIAEDLADASFAGMYETALNVSGAQALRDAVRRCLESGSGERVIRYRSQRAHTNEARMGVLVQRMVAADAAGVAFTLNPVTGDRDEVLVSAVRGLGDLLAAGTVTPDEWVVRDGSARCRMASQRAISEEQAAAVAALARRVEAHFERPQDIEWAIADGRLFLLQARPVTTLDHGAPPLPMPVEPPAGYWERDASHFPEPLAPVTRWWPAEQTAIFRRVFAEGAVLADGLDCTEIGGWVYTRLAPLGGVEPPPLPSWLAALMFPVLTRAIPLFRDRIRRLLDIERSNSRWPLVERWHGDLRPAWEARIAELRGIDLDALAGPGLAEHLVRRRELFLEGLELHHSIHLLDVAEPVKLLLFCEDHLGWDACRAIQLLCGLSEMSTEPARQLSELAELARHQPAVIELLQHVDRDTAQRIADADAQLAAALAAYQHRYGCRALRLDVLEPTLEECPELTLDLLADQFRRAYDPQAEATAVAERREAVVRAARAALASRPDRLAEFERLLRRATQTYPLREDNEFLLVSAPLAFLRYALLAAGRRLAGSESLDRSDDVFFLEWEELLDALGADAGDLRPSVRRRRAERAWVRVHPGPASFGRRPPAPPPLIGVASEVRENLRVVTAAMELIIAPNQPDRMQADGSPDLVGVPASAGTYTGTARVIVDESQFGRIRAGDVLVCPTTSPVWSVLFPSVGALVTDAGGVLSHPAIIAREYGIAAVVATGNATERIREGDRVRVDGVRGVVEILR
ncbi:MAG TPA: PEP/pyruvate-binding domain-containing protein [Candidatus Dormibacteraeota bacterium]|nr:PEP/pyruvate-binding domain-containing protein [Candidatus Dormibacteraeota bacterium]